MTQIVRYAIACGFLMLALSLPKLSAAETQDQPVPRAATPSIIGEWIFIHTLNDHTNGPVAIVLNADKTITYKNDIIGITGTYSVIDDQFSMQLTTGAENTDYKGNVTGGSMSGVFVESGGNPVAIIGQGTYKATRKGGGSSGGGKAKTLAKIKISESDTLSEILDGGTATFALASTKFTGSMDISAIDTADPFLGFTVLVDSDLLVFDFTKDNNLESDLAAGKLELVGDAFPTDAFFDAGLVSLPVNFQTKAPSVIALFKLGMNKDGTYNTLNFTISIFGRGDSLPHLPSVAQGHGGPYLQNLGKSGGFSVIGSSVTLKLVTSQSFAAYTIDAAGTMTTKVKNAVVKSKPTQTAMLKADASGTLKSTTHIKQEKAADVTGEF